MAISFTPDFDDEAEQIDMLAYLSRMAASITSGMISQSPEEYEENYERAIHRISTGTMIDDDCPALRGFQQRRRADHIKKQGKG